MRARRGGTPLTKKMAEKMSYRGLFWSDLRHSISARRAQLLILINCKPVAAARQRVNSTKKRSRLHFEDWGYLKSEWRKFTDRFVNSQLHIIVCGRAGFEYDYGSRRGQRQKE